MRISWKMDDSRHGLVDLTEATLEPVAVRFFRERPVSIKIDVPALNLPVLCDHEIRIHVHFAEADPQSSYMVRVLPAVHIADDEFGIEFDDLLRIEGHLQQIYPGEADLTHQLRLHALDVCTIRLFVHVERLSDRSIYSHQAAYMISFGGSDESPPGPRNADDNTSRQGSSPAVLDEIGSRVSEIDLES